jgi:predicted Ser/Thr protein kinase
LLEKREDFISILRATLNETQYFPKKDSQKTEFFINKYLNFIATKTLPQKTFRILIKEYSNTLIWWRRFIQKMYVRMAISKRFRRYFSHKHIKLPEYFKDFLLVGGNHRIRLFPEDLNYSLILLKKNENPKFCVNDARLRSTLSFNHWPKLIDYGNGWIREEYFEGTPLNRILDIKKREDIGNDIISLHWDYVIKPTQYQLPINAYKDLVILDVNRILEMFSDRLDKSLIDKILNTFQIAFSKLTISEIIISSTHGDFQMSNILVKDNETKIIDWEHSDNRFYLYDHFIFNSNLRSINDIVKAIFHYKSKILNNSLGIKISNDDLYLNIIEELRFSMNDDFSHNFNICGLKTIHLCEQIQKYFES